MKNIKYVFIVGSGITSCEIKNGCFYFDSEIDCDDFVSEIHYSLTKESTTKLLNIMSFNEIVEYLKPWPSALIEKLLNDNNIEYKYSSY